MKNITRQLIKPYSYKNKNYSHSLVFDTILTQRDPLTGLIVMRPDAKVEPTKAMLMAS